MEKMDRATEARILSSIERAIRLTKEGMESNKALLKIASEDRLHPEMVKRMAEAMNISRTRAHMQSTSAEKRADSFPLVDANWILDQMYPRAIEAPIQAKAANWIPDEYGKPTVENFFEVKPAPVTFTKAAEAVAAPSPFRESRLLDKQAGLKKSQLVAKSDFRSAMFELLKQAEAVAMQFRDAYRFDFPEVERRVFAKYGSSGRKMMDMIYGLGSLGRIKIPIKRASLAEPEQLVWDGKKVPYCWIDSLCKQADAVEALGRNTVEREYALASFNNEHGFKQAWEAQKDPGLLDDILGDLPPFSFAKRSSANPNLDLALSGVDKAEQAGRGAKTVPGQNAIAAMRTQKTDRDDPLAALTERQSILRTGSVPGLASPPAPTPAPVQAVLPARKPSVLPALTPAVLPTGMGKGGSAQARPFAKSAIDPLAVGMAMGPLALGLREPPELSKYREVLAEVYDPTHEAKMDSIKSKAMLNDFLSNDPILSSYEPEAVTNVYNQVASLSPSAARQPALMRGLLRKAIQQGGVIEPFEVQQLTQVEESLRGKKAPTLSHLYTAEK